MSELNKTYEIRDYNQDTDKAFIMATWLRGLYYGDSWFSIVPKSIFMNSYKVFLAALLPKSKIRIACLIEDKNEILGYSVTSIDTTILHWIFVKSLYRNQGIARSLTPKYVDSVSHLTELGKDLMKKLPDCVFNPFNLG